MTDLKKIIDRELENMTFNEVKNRRSIKMRKNVNFSVKRVTAAAVAVIAAATVLAVSTSAMGLWSISDFINRIFPDRNGEIEPYAFSSEISEEATDQFNFSAGNFLCDGNALITEFVVTKADGGEFTQEEFLSLSFNDGLVFPDITGMDSEIRNGGATYRISDDGLSWIITRTYDNLPRKIISGDNLQVKFDGVQEFVINTENGGGNYETFDDGTVIFNFTVPEIPDPIPLVFKNENGDKVFEAELTHLTMTASADEPIFNKYGEYVLYPDDISGYDEQVEWYISNPTNPKFYDENMQLTDDNAYNGNKYIINDDGSSQCMIPSCGKGCSGQNASILFYDDPEFEEARYIEWFDCIAEIP